MSSNSKSWSSHAEFVLIFVTLIGGYYMINQQIQTETCRIDQINSRMDSANSRMDTLHVMFYDLLREGKK